ncbi:MAG: hypothetical protein ABL998_08380 [Planctomycetota bacterium]
MVSSWLSVPALLLLGRQDTQEVDRWIEQLPEIGRQSHYDPELKATVLEPEVAALRTYVVAGGRLSDAQWRLALDRSRAICVRERWPVDEPLAISVEVPAWLSSSRMTVIPVRKDFTKAESAYPSSCGNCASSSLRAARYQAIGRVAPGSQILELAVSIDRDPVRHEQGELGERNLWQGVLSFTVVGVGSIQEVLPGARSPELDAAVRRALEVKMSDDETALTLFPDLKPVPELREVAVSLHVEVCKGSLVRDETSRAIYRNPGLTSQWMELDLPDGAFAGWNLHIRGVPDETLREWDALQHWNGELVIPLEELRRR